MQWTTCNESHHRKTGISVQPHGIIMPVPEFRSQNANSEGTSRPSQVCEDKGWLQWGWGEQQQKTHSISPAIPTASPQPSLPKPRSPADSTNESQLCTKVKLLGETWKFYIIGNGGVVREKAWGELKRSSLSSPVLTQSSQKCSSQRNVHIQNVFSWSEGLK